MSHEAAIQIEGLTRDFGHSRALDGLDLTIPRGIVFGFLGPNGAGKTTTIRLMLGLLRPTQGRIGVLGFDAASQADRIRAHTGALLEYSGLYERLSGEDNLEFYGRVWRMSSSERRERIQALLTHFQLWDRRHELISKWSRGMKQKLAIARALLHRPDLILLDEPTAGLDPVAAAALRDDLAGLVADEGVTVFLTTHNLSEAEKLCHQVGVVRQGKLLAVGRPEELKTRGGKPRVEIVGSGITQAAADFLAQRPEVRRAEIREGRLILDLTDRHPVAPLVAALVEAGIGIEEVRKSSASLEEVFLGLMEDES